MADGKSIRYLSINDQLVDPTGRLLPGVSSDGLHLEEPGYEIWAQALKPIFEEILGAPAEKRSRAATDWQSRWLALALALPQTANGTARRGGDAPFG